MQILKDKIECNNILVVDDDPDELLATSRMLRKAGYVVGEASSGEEAINKAKQSKPDLILLDVVMPGMDGFETCKKIKEDHQLKETFVVLLSSIKKTPDYKAKGLNAGADGFIERPFHSKEFNSRIRSIMRIKSVEKDLRMQRQWLRITLSSIGDGLIATDDVGHILFMNPVAERITGWPSKEAYFKNVGEIFNIIDSTTKRPLKGPIDKVIKEGRIVQLDDNVLLITKNQKQVPVADSASPIRDESEGIVGGVLVFRDITEKIRSEKEISQALKDWGAMFRAIGQMTLIIDPKHGILDANDVALEKTGLSREQIIGKKCFEIIHGASSPPEKCPMVKALKTGRQEASSIKIEKIEGDYFISCTPVFDSNGNIEKIVHIATDISKLNQAQAALQDSEEKYRLLFNSTYDSVILIDFETLLIIDANEAAEKMYGYSLKELLSLSAKDISAEKDKTQEAIQIEYSAEIPIRYHRKKDGSVFPVEITQNFLNLGDRKVVLGSIRDISNRLEFEKEKKELEDHLRQVQKMEAVGTLAGGVAHDFNNMLTVILGNTEILLEEFKSTQPLYDHLHEIQNAAVRSADVVRQLLAFARKQTIAPEILDINETIEQMLKMLRRLLGENIDLSWQPNAHLWPVKIDPSQIDQILANLCVNARDAIDGVGRLTIETGRQTFDEEYCNEHQGFIPGDFVMLAVSDNGCGMDRKTLDNLFEPFFTTKEVGKGTGLGLATVYGIVKQNNGFINVYSESGHGSTFKIYLPRIIEEKDVDKTGLHKKTTVGGTETVLLVEDEPSILRMTRMMIEKKGYTVLSAATPSEALEKATNHSCAIDLLMTDVVMPEMNGRDLAEEITKIYPGIQILFMSGYTVNVIAHQGVLDDGVAFLQKPFSSEDLARKLRKVLDKAPDQIQG